MTILTLQQNVLVAYNQTGSLIQTAVCVLYQEETQQHSVKHAFLPGKTRTTIVPVKITTMKVQIASLVCLVGTVTMTAVCVSLGGTCPQTAPPVSLVTRERTAY